MRWEDALPSLREAIAVVVTGPQRSGTTIAAQILAAELMERTGKKLEWLAAEIVIVGQGRLNL